MNYAVLTKKMRFFKNKLPIWHNEGTIVQWEDGVANDVYMVAADGSSHIVYAVTFALGARILSPLEVLAHSEMTEGLD